MKLKEWLRIALISIWINKTRSILAILSIFIGISAVVSLISIGNGTKKQVLDLLEELGTNVIDVYPDYSVETNQKGKITIEDVKAIENLSIVKNVQPRISLEKIVSRGDIKKKIRIEGVSPYFLSGEGSTLISGRMINTLDLQRNHYVCMIGKDVAEIFFKKDSPIGKSLRIGEKKFLIVGVLAWREIGVLTIGGWIGDAIFIPQNIAIKMSSQNKDEVINSLQIQFITSMDIEESSSFIVNFLKKRHKNIGNYIAESFEELIKSYTQINQTFTLVGVAIACISLVVGGIGIINMMLTSVLERRREIGIRMAIGARRKDILGQFLIEAITISIIGGILGIVGGILMANIASLLIKIPAIITLTSLILAVFFALLVGLFAGIYPAYKASRLDPIVALRYE